MAYFSDILEFPEQCRLGGVWLGRWADEPGDPEIAIGHFLVLPEYQDGSVECRFLTAHLPFQAGGFHGVFPDGAPWLFVMQQSPADAAGRLVGEDDPYWGMRDGLDRALAHMPGVELTAEVCWSRDDLLDIYAGQGVPEGQVDDWPLADLLAGLVGEMCNVDLIAIASGRITGCAFPDDLAHECAHDVFSDVFDQWQALRIEPPTDTVVSADDDEADGDGEAAQAVTPDDASAPDVPAGARRPWTREGLMTLRYDYLLHLALEVGWERGDVSGVRRLVLISLLTGSSADRELALGPTEPHSASSVVDAALIRAFPVSGPLESTAGLEGVTFAYDNPAAWAYLMTVLTPDDYDRTRRAVTGALGWGALGLAGPSG